MQHHITHVSQQYIRTYIQYVLYISTYVLKSIQWRTLEQDDLSMKMCGVDSVKDVLYLHAHT